MRPDRVEYLILFAGDAEPQVKTDTREAAEMWAVAYQERTGQEVRLIRRTWAKTDTPLTIGDSQTVPVEPAREDDGVPVLRSTP